MAALVGIAPDLRAVLAAQVALQLMDRRVLGTADDVERAWEEAIEACQQVLAGVGQHVELFAAVAADGAGIRLDDAEVHADAGEDGAVGLAHVAVLAHQIIGVDDLKVLRR